jgi:hypothetical protein
MAYLSAITNLVKVENAMPSMSSDRSSCPANCETFGDVSKGGEWLLSDFTHTAFTSINWIGDSEIVSPQPEIDFSAPQRNP